MREHQTVATLAALKFMAYGGPVTVFFASVGSTALGVAFWDKAGAHFDVLVVLGVTAIVLGFVEWSLARRFAAHERTEAKQYERVANIADDAAQQLAAFTRATREHTAALEGFRSEVLGVGARVTDLERRVEKIEERWMRPGLTPGRRPTEGHGP